MDLGKKQVGSGLIEPDLRQRAATAPGSSADGWLCAWCLNHVTRDQNRFSYQGRDEFTFTNPAGLRFEIITFSPAPGCRPAGTPTLEHTWFAGHAWSFCHCQECGQHLGWFYTGPQEFAGLIKNRIVRALCIQN